MNVDKLFKIPSNSIPSGKNKRKLTANPDIEVLKAVRNQTGQEEEEDLAHTGKLSSKGKGKMVQILDEVEEREYYIDEDEDAYLEEEEEGGRFFGGGLTDEQKKILEMVDQVEVNEPENLNLSNVRKMIIKFEKVITKNQELRVKFADDPTKFLDSETDLHEEIKNLLRLSESPELYPQVVKLGTITLLASLLSHENTDIVIDVVELLNELTDDDIVSEDNEESMKVFINALVENQVPELLVQNLARFDENEQTEKQGVFNTLGVVENLTSLDPTYSETIVNGTNLLQWLLTRVKVKGFDSNKQYASEILAILLQNSRANRIKMGELGGVDVLLRALNTYKRKDPRDADETEMMENFFDILCLSLSELEIKQKFLEGEGVELMLIMMREKMMSRTRAVKVLDHALSTPEGLANCEKFVEIFGLKTLFASFMGKGNKKLKKSYKGFSEIEEEEHIIGIIVSLFKNLPENSEHRLRLVNKFIESDYEKVEKLLELKKSYESKVKVVDEQIEEEKNKLADDDESDEIDEEEFYLKRLEGGLFTLQSIDQIITWISKDEPKTLENYTFPTSYLLKKSDSENDYFSLSFDQIKEHIETLSNKTGRNIIDANDVETVLEEQPNN
nr:13438_t:CDS:10 [Entrophospora candida]